MRQDPRAHGPVSESAQVPEHTGAHVHTEWVELFLNGIFYHFCFMCINYLHVCTHTACVPGPQGGQKRALGPPGLMAMSHHVRTTM